jgi:hypothetical protein
MFSSAEVGYEAVQRGIAVYPDARYMQGVVEFTPVAVVGGEQKGIVFGGDGFDRLIVSAVWVREGYRGLAGNGAYGFGAL